MVKKILKTTREILIVIIISLAILLPVRNFVVKPFYVKGASMEPSLYDHEYLIIDELSYRFGDPGRGDIIVFRNPLNPREHYIKRIVGLPGEKIRIKNGAVNVCPENGDECFRPDENYLPSGSATYAPSYLPVALAADEYYVLGDNRAYSRDSRIIGPVNRELIVGRVLLRGWPADKITLFNN